MNFIPEVSPFISIAELQKCYEHKKFSPTEFLEFTLDRFRKFDTTLGSALEIFTAEFIHSKSETHGPLYGAPGLIKDNICQEGRIASCASKILANYQAPYDATAVNRLKKAGALLVGRANCDEFAMGSSTETSAFQKTVNPWDSTKVPGGSSGGSIAAVAAGLVPWALGTETGGSVRQPAALCGIVGLKPTYGLISRYGVVAYASSMDQIGVATRTVYDNALVVSIIAGNDSSDATTLSVGSQDYTAGLDGKIPLGLRVGVIKNALYAPGVDLQLVTAIQTSLKQLEKMGAVIQEVDMPIMDYSAAIYFILSRAEAASNLARFDGVRYGIRAKNAQNLAQMYTETRSQGFGAEVKARIMIGNFVLSVGHADEFYHNARKAQKVMCQNFKDAFQKFDLLVAPTAPSTAFAFNAFEHDKLQLDLQDYFTCAANIAGIPAISVPCGFADNGLPLGMQFMGSHLSESLLFKVAHAYEQKNVWHTMHPPAYQ